MTDVQNVSSPAVELTGSWRKSTFSDQGACFELAPTVDGRVALRNSNDPAAGTLLFTRAEVAAFVAGCRAGEFDDLSV